MAARRPARKPTKANRSSCTLILIALFQLVKAILLIAVGIGALKVLHRVVASTALSWGDILRVDPENRFIHRILSRIMFITPAQLKAASAGTFVYAGLLLTEGTGLTTAQRGLTWASPVPSHSS